MKDATPPANPDTVMNAVAVARPLASNHFDDTTGPAVKATGPAKPTSTWEIKAKLKKQYKPLRG